MIQIIATNVLSGNSTIVASGDDANSALTSLVSALNNQTVDPQNEDYEVVELEDGNDV